MTNHTPSRNSGNGTLPLLIREGSPGSDDSGATSASTCSSSGLTGATSSSVGSGGNLVQKQIERLYGGKERTVPIRVTHQSSAGSSTTTSPPSIDPEKSFERQYNSKGNSSG